MFARSLSDVSVWTSNVCNYDHLEMKTDEFHKPLIRPGVKHDEEMSICSSTPQAHRGYINSSLLESDL